MYKYIKNFKGIRMVVCTIDINKDQFIYNLCHIKGSFGVTTVFYF